MKIIVFFLATALLMGMGFPDANSILEKVDKNLSSKNKILESIMTIKGKRDTRTVTCKSYGEGTKKSFTEYLSPASDKGTKMLKLDGQLWIYTPTTDRIIQISGHMLRQSLMGSDLSYEDMMEDRKLADTYNAKVIGEEKIGSTNCWILELTANVSDVAYSARKLWVDTERFIPLKEELFAKSGQLLKTLEMNNIQKIQGKWYPLTMIYKDVLKDGNGTEFKVTDIKFNQDIPDYIFSKAALKK